MRHLVAFCYLFFVIHCADAQNAIALLKYNGGGDWYANPTSLPNLVKFCNQNLHTNLKTDIPTVEVGSVELYLYPLVHLTGHGNIVFSELEAKNIRNYLKTVTACAELEKLKEKRQEKAQEFLLHFADSSEVIDTEPTFYE